MKRDLSVIIPAYNANKTIVRAIDSIRNQTYKCSKEIIIINDGSSDKTKEIIEEYIKRYPFEDIRLINQDNKGVANARNIGLQMVQGEWVAFLDSDDEWLPSKLESQFAVLLNDKSIDLLGSTKNGHKFKSNFFKKYKDITTISFKDQLLRNHFQPSTVIFKSKCLKEVGGFPENRRYAEEGIFFFHFTLKCHCVIQNKSLINFGFNKKGFGDGGLSGNIEKMQEGEIENYKYLLSSKYISPLTYRLLYVYSYLKYFRRKFIVRLKAKNK